MKRGGFISANPNPVIRSSPSGLVVTTLHWESTGTEVVEIRIGAPDGPLLSRATENGSVTTGEWVSDGMTFFLQDVSGELPLTAENSLGTVTVSLPSPQQTKAEGSVNSRSLFDNPRRFVQRFFNAYSAFKKTPTRKLDASGYDTDKEPEALSNYESFFRPLRGKDVRLLELGINKGGSLYLWRDYFERGIIVGLDVNAVDLNDPTGGIRVYRGLQQDFGLLDRIGSEVAPEGFDVIIDDASHIGEYSRASFWHLFLNHLRPGGIYVIEDWGTGYWDSWPDGKKCESIGDPLNGSLAPPGRGEIGKRQYQSHLYGMVGFIKELVDECGLDDLTNEQRGGAAPARSSKIHSLHISFGQVFVVKKLSFDTGR